MVPRENPAMKILGLRPRWGLLRQGLAYVLLWGPQAAFGATYRLSGTAGVMQQPTSNFYHAVYGANADVGTDRADVVLRLSYFERPVFRSMGYVDKDYGWSGLLGGKLTDAKSHGLYAYVGGGKVAGFIQTRTTAREGESTTRSFALPGITAAVEYDWQVRGMTFGFEHQTLIAFGDSAQTAAFVAWPYNLFLLSLGAGW